MIRILVGIVVILVVIALVLRHKWKQDEEAAWWQAEKRRLQRDHDAQESGLPLLKLARAGRRSQPPD